MRFAKSVAVQRSAWVVVAGESVKGPIPVTSRDDCGELGIWWLLAEPEFEPHWRRNCDLHFTREAAQAALVEKQRELAGEVQGLREVARKAASRTNLNCSSKKWGEANVAFLGECHESDATWLMIDARLEGPFSVVAAGEDVAADKTYWLVDIGAERCWVDALYVFSSRESARWELIRRIEAGDEEALNPGARLSEAGTHANSAEVCCGIDS